MSLHSVRFHNAVAWNCLEFLEPRLMQAGAVMFWSFLHTGALPPDDGRKKWWKFIAGGMLVLGYFALIVTIARLRNVLKSLFCRRSRVVIPRSAADEITTKHTRSAVGELGRPGEIPPPKFPWGQNLEHHPHVHYIVPAGGPALDGSRWIDSSRRFFLPVHALSRVFRGKFVAALKQLFTQGKLQFHGSQQHLVTPGCFPSFLRQLYQQDWVVYAKPPFGGAEHVLNFLARYTHRVAISNHRLVAFENDRVSFRWRDYAQGGKKKVMILSTHEFLRRFLLHVLPGGLVRSVTSDSSPTADEVLRSKLPRPARRNGMRRSSRATQPALSSLLRHHACRRTAHLRPALLPSKPGYGRAREVQC